MDIGVDTPYMLAELNGYAPEERSITVESWAWDGSKLTIKWNDNFVFTNPVKLDLDAVSAFIIQEEKDKAEAEIEAKREEEMLEVLEKQKKEKEAKAAEAEYKKKIESTNYGDYNSFKDKINEIVLSVSDAGTPLSYNPTTRASAERFSSLVNLIPGTYSPSENGGYNIFSEAYYTPSSSGKTKLASRLSPVGYKVTSPKTFTFIEFVPRWNKIGCPGTTGLSELDYKNTTMSFLEDATIFSQYLKVKEWNSQYGSEYLYPVYYSIVLIDFGDAQFYVGLL